MEALPLLKMSYLYQLPSMDCNMLSGGQLIEKGFSVIIKNENFELHDPASILVPRRPLVKNRLLKL
jgi:hypothetical protein